jgi:hypothetical protein
VDDLGSADNTRGLEPPHRTGRESDAATLDVARERLATFELFLLGRPGLQEDDG